MQQPTKAIIPERVNILAQLVHMTRLCIIGIKRSQLTRMAAALAYRTIFGLIPVIVVGLTFTAAFASKDRVRGWLESLLQFAGLSQISIPAGTDPANVVPESTHLDKWITDMVQNVQGIKWEVVTFIGIGTLIYAAISMLVEIEEAFNQIYTAPAGRSWVRRVTQYWTLLTLGSLFLIASFSVPKYLNEKVTAITKTVQTYIGSAAAPPALAAPVAPLAAPAKHETPAASDASNFAAAKPDAHPDRSWTGKLVASAFSLTVSFILFMVIYCVVPNTKVQVSAAAVGAVFTAVLWELAKQGFALYVAYSTGYANLYGALALLPMFLIWVYLTWIVVLFGLHVAHSMQAYRTATRQGLTKSVMIALGLLVEQHGTTRNPLKTLDPAAMVLVMSAVAERFAVGKPTVAADVNARTGLDEYAVAQMLEKLASAGLLHTVAAGNADEGAFVLSRPPQAIPLADILVLAQEPTDQVKSPSALRLLERFAKARLEVVEGQSLADALAPA